MTRFNPAHVNPPEETTPEEAERNKRVAGKNQAAQERKQPGDTPGTDPATKTPDPDKATG